MNTSPHFDDRVASRLTGIDTRPVLSKLRAQRYSGDTAVVLHQTSELVRCTDGSNGYYFVAVVRNGTAKTAFWTRDLDIRRLNVSRVSYL
jgi:hypothetical protein